MAIGRIETVNGILVVKAMTAAAGLTHSGPQTVDGVACVAGDIVFDKDNATGSTQGPWYVAAGAWTQLDPGMSDGLIVDVQQGTANADKTFKVTSASVWGTDTPTLVDQTGGSTGGMVSLAGAQTLTNKKLSTGTTADGNISFDKEIDHVVSVADTTTAATAGGAFALAAGKSKTSGTGGVASLTGGAGDTTGTGGISKVVGGAGGATSGPGGDAQLTGGAGSAGASAGGAATVRGGAGSTSSAGGNASTIGGQGGATGAGGQALLTGGAGGATSGNGGAVAVAGGAGTNGNGNGGNVTIDGGAKNGAGADGTVTIAGTTGDLNLSRSGGKIGLWGIAAAVKPAAFTMTYSTASHTNSNLTGVAVTDNTTGSTADTTLAAVTNPDLSAWNGATDPTATQATAIGAAITALKNAVAKLAVLCNQNTADILNAKQVLTGAVADLRTYGALQ